MPESVVKLERPSGGTHLDAPLTAKAYFMCVFAAFGGIFFGYDSGYINGIMGMRFFIHQFTGLPYPAADAGKATLDAFVIPAWLQSLIVSILSCGTFFGALMAGDLADVIGRRLTIILGCAVFIVGAVCQTASARYPLLISGRLLAGFGGGFVSATIILYMSEIAPRKVRGAIVAAYQFCITIGILLANCVVYATHDYSTSASYRIPIALQIAWAFILAIGLFLLPESPRFFVKCGSLKKAAKSLSSIRGQPEDSEYIQLELADIATSNEYELQVVPQDGYLSSWTNCFHGKLSNPSSNLRRTILGTGIQMMQQLAGINFIFYFGTTFFQNLGTISNPFFISLVTTLVNVISTPISFWTVERFGRRSLLIWGALGMMACEFVVAIIGTNDSNSQGLVQAEIVFICVYIFFYASTWGPGAWVVVGEIFPLPIRSRGVALSTASNWFWNCVMAVITPYMVGPQEANLGAKVFFIWAAMCVGCFVFAYFLVPETKGLSLEQVDRMLEETTPRTSSGWASKLGYASEMGLTDRRSASQRRRDAAQQGRSIVYETAVESQEMEPQPPRKTEDKKRGSRVRSTVYETIVEDEEAGPPTTQDFGRGVSALYEAVVDDRESSDQKSKPDSSKSTTSETSLVSKRTSTPKKSAHRRSSTSILRPLGRGTSALYETG